jgi:hypothetical protein
MQADDEYFLVLKKGAGSSFTVRLKNPQISVISQNPSPGAPPYINDQNPNGYWETGSLRYLTASLYLTENYGKLQNPVTESLSFGFSPIENLFTPQVGDKIRFQYDPTQIYTIYEVIQPNDPNNTEGRLYLKIDRDVSSNANTNNYVIYRILNDGKYITCNVIKNPSESNIEFTGVIIPRYASENLQNNIENIILSLKQNNIIEN